MFGYIRPLPGELKVAEHERFKACYCGLCHTLGRKYGVASRFTLSYELVFLSMLLWDKDVPPVIKRKRCIAGPCKSKRYCTPNTALDTCAGYNVILAWWKLRDTIADESFIKALPHRFVSLLLSRAYKRAAREYSGFDNVVKSEVAALRLHESQDERSFDSAADKFAKILVAATPGSAPENRARPLQELLYHLGRWIYIVDACDDYEGDVKNKRHNPIAARFPPVDGKIPEKNLDMLNATLIHSSNLMCLAFDLIEENAWTPIVGNILNLGMPDTCERIVKKTRNGNSQ